MTYYQTWIGVLASLLVLCIILDGSNLLSGLLEPTLSKIRKSIHDAEILLESYLTSAQLPGGDLLTALKKFRPNDPMYFRIKASIWEYEQIVNLHIANKGKIEADRRSALTSVAERSIRVSAPLYSLICCVGLFIVDGVGYEKWVRESILIIFLSVWLILSTLFWLYLWTQDWNRLHKLIKIDVYNPDQKNTSYGYYDICTSLLVTTCISIVMTLFINLWIPGKISDIGCSSNTVVFLWSIFLL